VAAADRHIPPGQGRVAAAYREGRFPRSELLPGGVVLLTVSLGLLWLGGGLAGGITELFGLGVTKVLERPAGTGAAMEMLTDTARLLLPWLGLMFAVGALFALLPALLGRRRRGRTAVPMPAPKRGLLALLVLRTFGVVLLALVALYIFKTLPLKGNGPLDILGTIGTGVLRLGAACGATMIVVGAGELLLVRHLVWRSLFLDKSESLREQRAMHGDPRMKQEQRRRPRRIAES
jgi:flagellar biosynthesis protein FlhB